MNPGSITAEVLRTRVRKGGFFAEHVQLRLSRHRFSIRLDQISPLSS